ncbi:hypothetical protein [Serratia odorifera]|jgi:hypothetical protein|uniref:hypothetical protein n=1 Tax=Serratia odorifera TaxID=618 RepID=UPI0018E7889B|nr:hypothetical protein [Serratia odorifera]MBJ2067963.1 hypothetical protein [Serratia odorifera]
MSDDLPFIDKTALTAEELAFQCLALAHAALGTNEPAVREALLFIILEKAERLYSVLS